MKVEDGFITKLHKTIDFRNKKILEVGCGGGMRTVQLAADDSTRITAIDPDKAQIALAKKNHNRKNISYQVGMAENLSFKDSSFDEVIFILSLHHTSSPTKALNEARRVVRKGGRIVVIEPGSKGTGSDFQKVFGGQEENEEDLKKAALKAMRSLKGVIGRRPVLSKTLWFYDNPNQFIKALNPTKNLDKLKAYLEKHNYFFWGERRMDIFIKE